MKTVLITGSSSGYGLETARYFHSQGWNVIATMRTPRTDLLPRSERLHVLSLDVTDPGSIVSAIEQAGPVDVLVNNAGIGPLKPMLELTPEEWHAMVDVNFNALFHVTRAVLPGMAQRGRGHVVVIGSITGRTAMVGGTCYASTKHAAQAFVECLNLEVRDRGVKVSIVNPGSVATDFSRRKDESWMLSPDEVAETVAHVLSTPADVLVHSVEIRALTPKK